jgi:hypothetical protein
LLRSSQNISKARLAQPRRILDSDEPEIEYLRVPSGVQHDIARLDVAMDYARFVGLAKALGDLDNDIEGFAHRHRSELHLVAQGEAVAVRYADEEAAVRRLFDLTGAADVRMIEIGNGLSLAHEAALRSVR